MLVQISLFTYTIYLQNHVLTPNIDFDSNYKVNSFSEINFGSEEIRTNPTRLISPQQIDGVEIFSFLKMNVEHTSIRFESNNSILAPIRWIVISISPIEEIPPNSVLYANTSITKNSKQIILDVGDNTTSRVKRLPLVNLFRLDYKFGKFLDFLSFDDTVLISLRPGQDSKIIEYLWSQNEFITRIDMWRLDTTVINIEDQIAEMNRIDMRIRTELENKYYYKEGSGYADLGPYYQKLEQITTFILLSGALLGLLAMLFSNFVLSVVQKTFIEIREQIESVFIRGGSIAFVLRRYLVAPVLLDLAVLSIVETLIKYQMSETSFQLHFSLTTSFFLLLEVARMKRILLDITDLLTNQESTIDSLKIARMIFISILIGFVFLLISEVRGFNYLAISGFGGIVVIFYVLNYAVKRVLSQKIYSRFNNGQGFGIEKISQTKFSKYAKRFQWKLIFMFIVIPLTMSSLSVYSAYQNELRQFNCVGNMCLQGVSDVQVQALDKSPFVSDSYIATTSIKDVSSGLVHQPTSFYNLSLYKMRRVMQPSNLEKLTQTLKDIFRNSGKGVGVIISSSLADKFGLKEGYGIPNYLALGPVDVITPYFPGIDSKYFVVVNDNVSLGVERVNWFGKVNSTDQFLEWTNDNVGDVQELKFDNTVKTDYLPLIPAFFQKLVIGERAIIGTLLLTEGILLFNTLVVLYQSNRLETKIVKLIAVRGGQLKDINNEILKNYILNFYGKMIFLSFVLTFIFNWLNWIQIRLLSLEYPVLVDYEINTTYFILSATLFILPISKLRRKSR